MTASGPWVNTSPSDDEGDRRADVEALEASREQAPQERTRGDHGDDASVEPVFHLPDLAALVGAVEVGSVHRGMVPPVGRSVARTPRFSPTRRMYLGRWSGDARHDRGVTGHVTGQVGRGAGRIPGPTAS